MKKLSKIKRRVVKGFYGSCKKCGKEIGDKRRNLCNDCIAFEV
jgi:RNA polymerase-binding transcription factor DksA